MANIIKHINRSIPTGARVQTFTSTTDSIVAGDIIKVETSLGYSAATATITASGGGCSFRVNSVVTTYPPYPDRAVFGLGAHYQILSSGVDTLDTSQSPIFVAAGSSVSLDGPIANIEVVTMAGSFVALVK